MASDLIYREDAKDFVRHAYHKGLNPVEYLDEVPAADVRPVVRARWKAHGDCGVTECPVCRWSIEECVDYNYCPNCGADMRGDKNGQIGEKDNG